MVMSILSAVFMTVYVAMTSIQLVLTSNDDYDYYNCDYDYADYDSDGCGCYDRYDEITGTTSKICADCIAPRDCNNAVEVTIVFCLFSLSFEYPKQNLCRHCRSKC